MGERAKDLVESMRVVTVRTRAVTESTRVLRRHGGRRARSNRHEKLVDGADGVRLASR